MSAAEVASRGLLRWRSPSSRGGFLLVEVLVSLVLLMVGLSAAVILLAQAAQVMERADLLARGAPVVAGEALFVPRMADGQAAGPLLELEWWWDDDGLQVVQRRRDGAPFAARRIRVPWGQSSAGSPWDGAGP